MIDFELSPEFEAARKRAREDAEKLFRPISRYYDEHEHESADDLMRILWQRNISGRGLLGGGGDRMGPEAVLLAEETFRGDAGLALSAPGPGLAGAALTTSATPEQRERFLKRFTEGEPKWGCMAITEPGCGSDTAAIATTAVRNGDEWVLNGEKMFASKAKKALDSGGIIVVWATVDKSARRAGIKPFVVEAGTPGARVEKVEDKLGIRAEETCVLVLDNCRIPYNNIIGSPEVIDKTKTEGFKRAMATFDFTRPFVAAMALGVGRAALDFVRETFEEEGIKVRYGLPRPKLTAVERDVMEMESNMKAAELLAMRAVWMLTQMQRNDLQASMAKTKAGLAVTRVTQKAVELLGPLGYSRKNLVEKWMRDSKINDIFEGTGQINTLIVARRILGYNREQLK